MFVLKKLRSKDNTVLTNRQIICVKIANYLAFSHKQLFVY